MIDFVDLIDILEDRIPQEWTENLWINHSDLPNSENPTSFRCSMPDRDGTLTCCHAYRFDERGVWSPGCQVKVGALPDRFVNLDDWYEDGTPVRWMRTKSFKLKVEEFFLWIPTVEKNNMRKVWIARCECGIVHYCVERMSDEWHNLSWNQSED